MAGYTTMARVSGGRVRAIAWDGAPARLEVTGGDGDAAVPARGPRRGFVDPSGPRPTLRERWESAGEELGMLTFFLLDPESWR